MVLEASIIKSLKKKLKKNYPDLWYFKTHGQADQVRGLPDLIGCYHGYFIAMEVKKPEGHATDLQAFTIKQIRAAGGYATVIHSYEEAEAFLATVPEPLGEAREERDN